MQIEIVKDFIFEAAHFLPNVADTHRCQRIHGHTYQVSLHLSGPLEQDKGWIMDFHDIESVFQPILDQLDHHLLNEVPGLEVPTAENIALWVWQATRPHLPGLCQVTVHENPTSRAIVRE